MAGRHYYATLAGVWSRYGWLDPTIPPRRTDYGSPTYEATLLNTGTYTPEAVLLDGAHDYNSSSVNSVTIPNGAHIVSKVIYGDITFAGSALIEDCLLLGGAQAITSDNNLGILWCTNVRTGMAVIKDSIIRPRTESDGRDCALGHDYHLERCVLSGGVDGAGIYNTSGPNANVNLYGNYIHDLAYDYPDRDHDDGTHNDPVQIQGGRFINIQGNTINGTGHWMAGSSTYYNTNPSQDFGDWPLLMPVPHCPGNGILVNGNVQAVDSTVVIDNNVFRNCKAMFSVGTQGNNFQFTNNRFSSIDRPAKNVNGTVRNGVSLTFTSNEYWIRLANKATYNNNIIGLVSAGIITNTTNVWLDGANAGVALAEPRASGINNNNQA